mmetsp:Transcript_10718/g.19794  ORF Transcript_10718/g.19794 Transcript_10718/m.19794 type:complete len:364 (-) Transcript_10718:203-1294(-)
METSTCHKIKALLLVALLGVAEAHQVQQAVRLGALPHSQSKVGVDVKSDVTSSSALARFLLAHNPTTAFIPHPLARSSASRHSSTNAGALRHGLGRQAPVMRTSNKDEASAAAASEGLPANPFSSAFLPMVLALAPAEALAAADKLSKEAILEIGEQAIGDVSGFNKLGFYTTLLLAVVSYPGLYSFVKRQTKSKVIRKVFEMSGPAIGGKAPKFFAAEMIAYFQANNYKVVEATEDLIVFEGKVGTEFSRAAFIGSCALVSFIGLALLLSTLETAALGKVYVGNFWYLLCLAGPASGKYYLDNGERTDQASAKIWWDDEDDDIKTYFCTMQGDDEELERFQSTLDLREKDLVYIKPLVDTKR